MKVVIFDLDGTLANIGIRREIAQKDGSWDWDEFFNPDNIAFDKPNEPVIDFYNMCEHRGYKCVIFSGRNDRTKSETMRWINRYLNGTIDLTMRENGDYTNDAELKKKWLLDRFKVEDIYFVVDDRNQVVNMWRELGLTCFQVADGNF